MCTTPIQRYDIHKGIIVFFLFKHENVCIYAAEKRYITFAGSYSFITYFYAFIKRNLSGDNGISITKEY